MDFSAIHAGRGKPKRGFEPLPLRGLARRAILVCSTLDATGQTEFAMELRGRFKGYFTIKKSPMARASMPAQ